MTFDPADNPTYGLLVCVVTGDLGGLALQVKQQVCAALDSEGLWEMVSHSLGLGILNVAFRLSPSPATTLLDSYEVHTCAHTRTHCH